METVKRAPVTIVLTLINIVVFLLLSFGGQPENEYYMLAHGAMYTPGLEREEYYRLFTSIFMHFGIEHLVNNMLVLVVIGTRLEPVLGSFRTALLFVCSGLAGNIVSLFIETEPNVIIVSAGASGAVFGFSGALLCLTLMYRGSIGSITWKGMLLMVALNLYAGYSSERVNNAAHIGGLIAGILITLLVGWNLNKNKRTHGYT